MLMNVADSGIVATKKKLKCQFHSENCMALTTGLFVFFWQNKCARTGCCPVQHH